MELISNKYKQTEVGLIPSDWEVKPLSDVVDFLDGQRRPIKSNERNSGEFPYYGASGIIDYVKDYIFDDALILLGEDGENILSRNLPLAFKVKGKIWVNNHAHVLKPKDGYNITYLTDYLESLNYSLLNSGTAQPKLNKQACLNIKIAVPTLTEQTAIATALSDADALISSLEKLIAKKRNIKQGAMQKLLQPKEGWEVKKLGEVASFYKGKGLPKSYLKENGKYKCIHYGELFTKYKERIDTILSYTDENENCFYSVSNDVLMPTSDVTPNGLATASCIKEDGIILGGDVLVIRILPTILDGLFLSFYITQNREQVMKLVSGSTVYHLYGSDMKDFEIVYPKITEQNRIARILSDMDAEISALETKLEKYKKVKTGMMQNLLTGKIRLV